MVLGSSVGMMEIKPIDKPETPEINQETKSKILMLNTLGKDSILSNNPALLSKIEEFLGIAEQNLIYTYSQEQIKLTLPPDVSDEIKKQLIIIYNLISDWTDEVRDLIKNITVEEDGRLLVYNTSEGDLELKAGNYGAMIRLCLIDINYKLIKTKYFDNYLYSQIILVCNLSNLSLNELNKFKTNVKFHRLVHDWYISPPVALDLNTPIILIKHAYEVINIELTLPADASDETRKQLIMLYNLKKKWTSEAKDLIKSINVIMEDGKIRLMANTSKGKGGLELKSGYYEISGDHMYIKTTPGICLISKDYDYNDWQFYKSKVLIPICNLSTEDLGKFDVNGRFNRLVQMKKPITMRRP